jgi:phosphoserine phosphatase
MLGFDLVSANVLAFSGRKGHRILTGEVVPPIRDRNDKLERLIQESAGNRIQLAETIAVGDGANDLPMLLASGLGVAFHAKPAVKQAVRARVDHAGLKALLFAQGYKADEIVAA